MIPSEDLSRLLTGLAMKREQFCYWPAGKPTDWRTGAPIGVWESLVPSRFRNSSRSIKAQALVRELERQMTNAGSFIQRAEAIWLIRCWKTQRGMKTWTKLYRCKVNALEDIWQKCQVVCLQPAKLERLKADGIGIAIATAFASFASTSHSLGILDVLMAREWTEKKWVRFKLRSADGYVFNVKDNWMAYAQYNADLSAIACRASSMSFWDPLANARCQFSARDVEMALWDGLR